MLLSGNKGFTLVELMISMVVGALAMGAVSSSFQSQHANYLAQDQVVELQQNLRTAMDIMTREIRMAGFDPTLSAWQGSTPTSILVAEPHRFALAMDLNENGVVVDPDGAAPNSEPGEVVAFGFGRSVDKAPADGIADRGAANLGRNTAGKMVGGAFQSGGGGFQPIAENIEAVGFAYAFDANHDGILEFSDLDNDGIQDPGEPTIWAVDTDGDGNWDDLDNNADGRIDALDLPEIVEGEPTKTVIEGFATGIAMDPTDVRAVRVWILARARAPDGKFTNTNTYVVGRQVITVKDNFRRRILETTVACRNMGLVKR